MPIAPDAEPFHADATPRSEDGQRRLRVDYYINDRLVELPPSPRDAPEEAVKAAVAKVLEDLKKTKNLEPGQLRVVVEASQTFSFTDVQDLTLALQELGLASFQAKVRGGPEQGGP